jgi:hypothetical protein
LSPVEFLTESKKNFDTETKYFKWYITIIYGAIQQNRTKHCGLYFEAHHILPKSIYQKFKSFRTNPWNMVLLTAKEHFIAHVLLVRMAKNKKIRKKMASALSAKTSREYAKVRAISFLANSSYEESVTKSTKKN